MADAEAGLPERKRDRMKRYARRAVPVPLSVRTSDLPKRAASALVMLAVAGAAFWAGGVWWLVLVGCVALVCFAEFARLIWRAATLPTTRIVCLVLGAAYVTLAAVFLGTMPRFYLLLTVGSVICTDTFAYFAGRAIGGPKIAPAISPSKTWAGLAGGMAGAAVFGVLLITVLMQLDTIPWSVGLAVAIGGLLAIAAQAGDFFESWLKRKAHLKDSSNLIPGHGGVFDRVDGLLPVAILAGLLVPAVT
jgi:phosphatidate cytidylyltransferase